MKFFPPDAEATGPICSSPRVSDGAVVTQRRIAGACPLCKSTSASLAFSAKDYEYAVPGEWAIVKCTDCGFLFMDPMPHPSELAGFYPPTYYSYDIGGVHGWLFKFVFWVDARRMNKLTGGHGAILDIGCGDGSALLALNSLGDFKLYGLEYDGVAVERARKRGLDVRSGDLSGAGYAENAFDLIRMGHVIEHVADPMATLRRAFEVLKPGGVLFGETPNADCTDFRLFGRYWGALHAPRHLVFFNRTNLKHALETAGFVDVRLSPRLRTVGWSAAIQNVLADKFGLKVPPSGRVWWYSALILLCLPLTAIQSLFGTTAAVGFEARKPV